MIKTNYSNLILFILFVFFIGCNPNSKQSASLDVESTVANAILCDSIKANLKSKVVFNSSESLKIVSWNIQDLGQSKSDDEIDFIVNAVKDFDLVAIQEVVAKHPAGAQKVAQIAEGLNRKGFKWDYRISNPTNSPSAKMSERYAYIWKTSRLDIVGSPYLDSKLASKIIREPFISKFKLKSKNIAFYIVNFHSRKHNDQPEIEIEHFQYYLDRLSTQKLIIAGDFNLSEKHKVWNGLYKQGFKSALNDSKTTLKQKCKKNKYLSHEIDNVYFSKDIKFLKSGVIDYVETCANLKAARLISDHLPVFLEFTINE
ncbi:endonuclease/exonuclease/phosphatase family protein [Gaetbulibacter sp. PBL-D1]|uniref:endonuclease/exonuclease/phosphatase family protein n=1 Tax=Gaetbulibacter sp. PBL-D1 TaxID=3422594 RepID=UPI003D2EBA61